VFITESFSTRSKIISRNRDPERNDFVIIMA
jgi:hypothetical protein